VTPTRDSDSIQISSNLVFNTKTQVILLMARCSWYGYEALRPHGDISVGLSQIDSETGYDQVEFIMECCRRLKLDHRASGTAAVLFHRFFQFRTRQEYNPEMISTACVFLSAKVTEDPRKLRDVINMAHSIRSVGKTVLAADETYWEMKEKLIQMEQMVCCLPTCSYTLIDLIQCRRSFAFCILKLMFICPMYFS